MTHAAALLSALLLAAPGHVPTVQDVLRANAGVMLSHAVGRSHDCEGFYPKLDIALGHSGAVLVGYDVEPDGTIDDVRVLRSSGWPRLDEAAVRCVSRKWRDTPMTRDGVAVASPNHEAMIVFRMAVAVPQRSAAPVEDRSPQTKNASRQAKYAPPRLKNMLPRIGGNTLAVAGALALAILTAAFFLFARRRLVVSGPVVCGRCGVVNVLPARVLLRPKCSACGQPFNI